MPILIFNQFHRETKRKEAHTDARSPVNHSVGYAQFSVGDKVKLRPEIGLPEPAEMGTVVAIEDKPNGSQNCVVEFGGEKYHIFGTYLQRSPDLSNNSSRPSA